MATAHVVSKFKTASLNLATPNLRDIVFTNYYKWRIDNVSDADSVLLALDFDGLPIDGVADSAVISLTAESTNPAHNWTLLVQERQNVRLIITMNRNGVPSGDFYINGVISYPIP